MTAVLLTTQRPESIPSLFIFGDSLSDTGTLFHATKGTYPPNPPYFQGRYSNGRVWVEYFGDRLHIPSTQIHNFARGGATTGRNGSVPGLLFQVQSWLKSQPSVSSTALYIVWAGANDYLQGMTQTTIPVQNIMGAIASLTDAGARRILVANLPDLGNLPATRNDSHSSTLSTLTETHNRRLRQALKGFSQQHPDLKIISLDVNALYRDAIAQPAKFGFTNVTQACLSSSRICNAPNQFLFWDGIHPSTAAHQLLGEAAFKATQQEGLVALLQESMDT